MKPKIEVTLCMGSSCFARGNNLLLDTLEQILEARGWRDAVTIAGQRCEDRCSSGPNIRIDGELYHGLDEGALLDLLETKLGASGPSPASSVRRHKF